MPGLNGTGPNGQGPMTGRGMGNCNTTENVNTARPFGAGLGRGFGRGMGRGRGRGFGLGRGFGNQAPLPARIPNDDRIAEMESQISMLQQEISTLRQQNENSNHQR